MALLPRNVSIMTISAIEALLEESRRFPPSPEFSAQANANADIYAEAERDYEQFWASWARTLEWSKPFTATLEWNEPFARWFADGELNVSVNCLDRHVRAGRGDKIAYYYEGEPGDRRTITYRELLAEVNRFANGLRELGIGRGDRVAIYMPMIPELPVAMLACARIGAPHSVIFGGFSPESIVDRVNDAACVALVTADFRMAPRKEDSAQTQLRHRDGADAIDRALHRCSTRRRRGFHARGARLLVGRDRRESVDGVRARGDECRGPALSALHERHDGETERDQAHDGRLLDARRDDAQTRLRFEGRPRRLLVHRRHRLGDRTLVYRLRAVGERRDQRPLRRHARLSRQGSILGDCRAVSRDDSLHRADGDSHVHEMGTGVSGTPRPLLVASARHRRRTNQSGSVDVVSRVDRWKSHPGARHVVADRDRRHHDRTAARRHDAAAGKCDQSASRHFSRYRQRCRRLRTARRRRIRGAYPAVARDAARHMGRRRALRADVLVKICAPVFRRRRRPARCRRKLLVHGTHRRRNERQRPSHLHDRSRVRWSIIRPSPRRLSAESSTR